MTVAVESTPLPENIVDPYSVKASERQNTELLLKFTDKNVLFAL